MASSFQNLMHGKVVVVGAFVCTAVDQVMIGVLPILLLPVFLANYLVQWVSFLNFIFISDTSLLSVCLESFSSPLTATLVPASEHPSIVRSLKATIIEWICLTKLIPPYVYRVNAPLFYEKRIHTKWIYLKVNSRSAAKSFFLSQA